MENEATILENLHIMKKQNYEAGAPGYTGSATFKNKYGSMTINLDEQFSAAVLKLVADSMERQARQLGSIMASEIIQSAGALPAPDA